MVCTQAISVCSWNIYGFSLFKLKNSYMIYKTKRHKDVGLKEWMEEKNDVRLLYCFKTRNWLYEVNRIRKRIVKTLT